MLQPVSSAFRSSKALAKCGPEGEQSFLVHIDTHWSYSGFGDATIIQNGKRNGKSLGHDGEASIGGTSWELRDMVLMVLPNMAETLWDYAAPMCSGSMDSPKSCCWPPLWCSEWEYRWRLG